MSYEHLKASWRAEVEAIVRAELSKMEAEIARMHHQVEQSFTQLLSQSAARLAAVSHDPAIADFTERAMTHLAAVASPAEAPPPPAPAQAETPPAEPPPATPAVDLQALYYYLVELQSQTTQAEVLNLLVTRALEYAPRVALFVVKSGNMVAWAERGFEAAGVSLRGLTLSLQARTTLMAAVERQSAVLDSPYAYAENQILLDRLGGVPEAMAGVPLLVRGKAAAVLYADTGDQPTASVALPPLQILVNTAGLTVELLNARSRLATTTTPVADRATQTMPAPAVESAPPAPTKAPTFGDSTPSPQSLAPAMESHAAVAAPSFTTPAAPAETVASPPTPTETYTHSAAVEEQPAEPRSTGEAYVPPPAEARDDERPTPADTYDIPSTPEPVFEPQPLPPVVPPGPTIQEPETAATIRLTSPPAEFPAAAYTPPFEPTSPTLESPAPPTIETPAVETASQNNGFTVPPLNTAADAPPTAEAVEPPAAPPKPTSEEEAKAHNDARRFARLLVSEIKLYNEAKVAEGRLNRDLYDRLKEDIDRSRQMYDKRVNPIVAAKFDYFYDELVSSLAEGDKSRLGADCPGPVLLQPE